MRSLSQLSILGLALFMSAGLSASTIYVDDDAPNDPGPGDPSVSDPLEDGTIAHPYDAIMAGNPIVLVARRMACNISSGDAPSFRARRT